ncbi:hypothetical protein LEP1GSC036_2633 [Leptospira weilii str. 2006001853]|uniref:Uncharacterized protein n=1 Tax=Leptospira weilii str. 2006001853 TaxID=1001589 RepID=A0A828Z5Z3_9LEPT|nr:GTPase domain-containing protein [Leptospira weilii]EKR65798.1 hypothetical protein LEP1GSC036_2633 [Leptospira weilii str. 2006001853]
MERIEEENKLNNKEEGINSDAFFKEFSEKYKEVKFKNTILTILIWGWVGDGKTVSILTAKHYLDLLKHGISLGEIVDQQDLKELEKSNIKFENLRALDLAKNTLAFVREYTKEFIENCEWPKGTNKHIPFLLRIDTFDSKNAYLYIPDLPGGSFQEADDISSHFINGSNGIIILVDPKRYKESSHEARKYVSEVRYRIKFAAEKKIPTVIFINKADDLSGIPTNILDSVHEELTIYRSKLAGVEDEDYQILRSSVIGSKLWEEKSQPKPDEGAIFLPSADLRNPLNILKGWVWLIYKGYENSKQINDSIPSLHFRNHSKNINSVGANLLDIRLISNYKNLIGLPILIISDSEDKIEILFLTEDGKLNLVKFGNSSEFKTEKIGEIIEFDSDMTELKCFIREGFLVIGKRKNTSFLYSGILGSDLNKTELEHPVYSWELMGNEELFTSNENGNLSILKLENKKWIPKDFLTEFLPKPSKIELMYDFKDRSLFAHNGTISSGVRIANNKFGDRFEYKVVPKYDAESADVYVGRNLSLVSLAGEKFLVFDDTGKYSIAKTNFPEMCIVNQVERYAVVITKDNFIRIIHQDSEGKYKLTEDHFSKQLEAKPDAILLSEQSNSIFVFYKESGISIHFKIFGI